MERSTYDGSPHEIRNSEGGVNSTAPPLGLRYTGDASNGMNDNLEDNDTAQPSVDQVEGVKGDAEEPDQRVVPPDHGEQEDHVDDGESPAPVPQESDSIGRGRSEADLGHTVCNIRGEVADQEDKLQSCGKSADVEGRAELKFPVVSLAEYRSIEDVPLEPGSLW
jgi:hypothetical protein